MPHGPHPARILLIQSGPNLADEDGFARTVYDSLDADRCVGAHDSASLVTFPSLTIGTVRTFVARAVVQKSSPPELPA